MEPNDIERLLLQNLKIAKENNTYLRKMDNRQRWSRNIRIFYWAVIIIVSVLGYYYAMPYIQGMQQQFSQTLTTFSSFAPFANKAGQ